MIEDRGISDAGGTFHTQKRARHRIFILWRTLFHVLHKPNYYGKEGGYGSSAEEKYLTADEYLSGNVREKLEWARRSAELYPKDYAVNVQALERVQPVDLTASEISVQLGSTWLPPKVVEQFVFELLAPWNLPEKKFTSTMPRIPGNGT